MEALGDRVALLGRALALLAAYAVVMGAASVILALDGIGDGETVALTRAALGVLGVAAGLLAWTRHPAGWPLLAAWCAAQVPFIAWSVEGNALRQVIDMLLGVSSSTTVNGVVTASEQYGINGVGVLLVIWAMKTRERWARVQQDRPVRAATA